MIEKCADIIFKENRYVISGDVTVSNVMLVYEKSLLLFNQCPELHFDFSQLKSSDSSGLALIMEWIKFAKQNHRSISFSHFPPYLMSIAKASRLDELISV